MLALRSPPQADGEVVGWEGIARPRLHSAYLIRRRTKKFTDCKGKFKYLNKHCSLEFTIKKQALWPDILTNLGIKFVKFFQKSD